jgi:hypothetical protein
MSNSEAQGDAERCWFCGGLIVPENIAPEGEYGCRICGLRAAPGSIHISKEAAKRFLNVEIEALQKLATSGVSRTKFGQQLVETLHLCLAAKGVMYWQRQYSWWPFGPPPLPKLEFSYGRTTLPTFAAEIIGKNSFRSDEANLQGEPMQLIGVPVWDKNDRTVAMIQVVREPEPDPDRQLFCLKVVFHFAKIAATCPAMMRKA